LARSFERLISKSSNQQVSQYLVPFRYIAFQDPRLRLDEKQVVALASYLVELARLGKVYSIKGVPEPQELAKEMNLKLGELLSELRRTSKTEEIGEPREQTTLNPPPGG